MPMHGMAHVVMGSVASMQAGSAQPRNSIRATLQMVTGRDGTAVFDLTLPAGVDFNGAPLAIAAAVTEAATGEQQNSSRALSVAAVPLVAELTCDAEFAPGLPFRARLAIREPDGSPASGASLPPAARLGLTASLASGMTVSLANMSFALDSAGVFDLVFSVPHDPRCCNSSEPYAQASCCSTYLSLTVAGVPDVSASTGAARATADPSGGFLKLGPVTVAGTTLSFSPAATGDLRLRWVLVGPAGIAAAGMGAAGDTITVTASASATALLVWRSAGRGLAYDWAPLSVAAPLPANLTAAFGAASVAPGDSVSVSAAGVPSCRVFFAATDVSVALMGADAVLRGANITDAASAALASAIAAADATAISSEGQGRCWSPSGPTEAGALVLTSAEQPPCTPMMYMMRADNRMADNVMAAAAMPEVASMSAGSTPAASARIRSAFPETFLWRTADADAAGNAALQDAAPDTITSWKLSAFAIHPTKGIAVAPIPPQLVVTQPFYMRVVAPATLVRGETLLLRVGLFSNLTAGVSATVFLVNATTSGFLLDGAPTGVTTVPPGGAASVTFGVTPTAVGQLALALQATASDGSADALLVRLTVVPPGVPAEVTQNVLLRVGQGASAADAAAVLSAAPPASAVPDSAVSTLTVMGDLMGQSLGNLGALLSVPSGCGEQNMIGMAPNIAVLQYAAANPAAQLPAPLLASAAANAALGVQRELTYRHPDGSFSAFGPGVDGMTPGSTWLTAFVVSVFSSAASFVTVDDSILQTAAGWLAGTQAGDGSFASRGNVIHTELVGGVSSTVSLTAFVLAALLKAPPSISSPSTITAAAAYLATHPAAPGDVYATQLRAHALAAACASPLVLRCVDARAAAAASMALAVTPPGGLLHWEAPRSSPAATSWQSPPEDIELTAYGVLHLLASGRTSDAVAPARWLLSQRNGAGGFGSTQDTVVGLAALAGFAAATAGKPPSLRISVSAAGMADATVTVDADSAPLLQQLVMPAGAPVSVAASGIGMALVQLTIRYTVLPPSDASAAGGFAVEFAISSIASGSRRRLLSGEDDSVPLLHTRLCATRSPGASPARAASMVILEAGLFSGNVPIGVSLDAIRAGGVVSRVETDLPNRRVLFYLNQLAIGQTTCVAFDALQSSNITKGLAPATARAYSYYSPMDATATTMQPAMVTSLTSGPPSGATTALGGRAASSGAASLAWRAGVATACLVPLFISLAPRGWARPCPPILALRRKKEQL